MFITTFFSIWDDSFIDSFTKYVKNVKDLGVCSKNHENSKFDKNVYKLQDVVSVLLDSKVANPNILNKAGYTCIMLISLAQINSDTNRAVVRRLFSLGDINIRGSQHGQTALMLAVSHGRLEIVQLLVESGADLNIRDEDGSSAL